MPQESKSKSRYELIVSYWNTYLLLQDGLMRLKLPNRQPGPQIWNTPAPPDLSSCEAYGTDHLSRNQILKLSGPDCFSWQHLHAVEVDKIRGITFHFHLQTFAGIHIHYEEKPSTMDDKYEQFTNRSQDTSTWIYLPIPKNDQLLALGIRQMRRVGMNILARTRLVGDVIIGPQFLSPFKDLGLSESVPQTIVYSEAPEGSPVTFLGTYSKPPHQDEPPKLFSLEKYGGLSKPHPLGLAPFFSWASLEDVSSTLTFNDRETGFCKGIMFQYRNGGCRTVGQCRWHVDSAIRVGHPRVLHFKYVRKPTHRDSMLHAVRVAFQKSHDEQPEKGWECHPLKGFVAFWFTEGSSYLAIKADKAHPDLDMSVPERMNY
ncbi:hypothetical protein FIE12Z_10274 [Fusarium flagelliforme]|uniref:Uncharacterized protein n=1 Tax=Fusarium flagelliforme TaxID=2675880 RepID=A0A395MCD5_9HYPO|nr:hypothetical protein FIE12Z_10274 [Fusarium flagelliforme]